MFPLRRVFAVLVAVAALLASLATGLVAASAATTPPPPWEPDPSALGTLTLYDASGNVVTGGTTTTNMATIAYAVGSNTRQGVSGDSRASLYLATPNPNIGATSQYPQTQLGPPSTYPNPAAPGSLKTASPLYTGTSNDEGFYDYATDPSLAQTSTTPGYVNMYQLRLYTSGVIQKGTAYDRVDIMITPNTATGSGSWSVVYPAPAASATSTTTVLSVGPTSPAPAGTQETLTATVSPTVAAGTVTFTDGSTSLGSSTVTNGMATLTATLGAGSHSLTATFAPTDTTTYGGSSNTVTYQVAAATTNAVPTTTTLSASPTGSQVEGNAVTLTATVARNTGSGAAPTGSVSFLDGSYNLGTYPLANGTVSVLNSTLSLGEHELTANYLAYDTTAFGNSQSSTIFYTITAPIAPAAPPAAAPGGTSGAATPQPAAVGAPTIISAPSLGGLMQVGRALICLSGTFSNTQSFTYAFFNGGTPIGSPSSSPSLVLSPALLNQRVSCTVTATGPGGSLRAMTGNTLIRIGAKIYAYKKVSVSGAARVRTTLHAKVGSWSERPVRYYYLWLRDGHVIPGAHHSSYTVSTVDLGHTVSCRVTARATGYLDGSAVTPSMRVR